MRQSVPDRVSSTGFEPVASTFGRWRPSAGLRGQGHVGPAPARACAVPEDAGRAPAGVGESGIEPPRPEATALQAAELTTCSTHRGRVTGLEPAAAWFTARLLGLSVHPQCAMQDSNLPIPVCGTGALPLS